MLVSYSIVHINKKEHTGIDFVVAGSCPRKMFRLFSHMKVPTLGENEYFRHQKYLLSPALRDMWSLWQEQYFGGKKKIALPR